MIADALSKVDEAIDAWATLITKKRAIRTATSQQLLTGRKRLPDFSGDWERLPLAGLGEFRKGKGIRRTDLTAHGRPCVRYGELYTTHHNLLRDFASHIPASVAERSEWIESGDILFAGSGETKEEIGKSVAYTGEAEAYAGGDIVILSGHGQNAAFLGYALNAPAITRQKASFAQGDAVVHISARNLGKIEIALPPLDEQTAIAEVLSDMDEEIGALEKRREKTEMIKKGMMQELLTGRTRLV